ncbi:membrane integrity-associated transporter subunit PqiA [Rahnella woolbedingensis]|uniref:Membrane integrity-associated transporter subunit PqiA n=1 Tax=Rahnella woolbedingensis TaxID=1510574 RepID=A0A419NEU1_9GAMM|nr:membrane integrity-associated transporter subunit PqiA [Rahnella woolbedingensis]RJT47460.1 membrane integrity-associated transporter subunit PqiA [Rahnella woolbedingensis]
MCSHVHDPHILCPQCDLLVAIPEIAVGQKAKCPRCHTTLTSRWKEPRRRPIAYAVSALFMLLLSNLFPFVNMKVAGLGSEVTLIQIPQVLVSDDYASMASLFMILVQLMPALGMIFIIILCQGTSIPSHWQISIARNYFRLKAWCMVEIFLAGVLVSFVKLMAYGDVGVGTSFYPFVLFCILQLRAFQCTDRYWIWQQVAPAPKLNMPLRVGESGLSQGLRSCHCCMAILPVDQKQCDRCETSGHARRKNSLQWTMALLITSIFLYIPANLMPIMITQVLGSPMPSTIMAGVVLLWSEGSYPVAMVILIASIMVPTLKMIAIGWLCWDANSNKPIDRERLHVIYEVVEFVGRWSMIDVFVIAVLSALVRMGQLMSIYPDIGALLFASVVILTMFAAMTFDPRLIWDRAVMKSAKEPQDGGK